MKARPQLSHSWQNMHGVCMEAVLSARAQGSLSAHTSHLQQLYASQTAPAPFAGPPCALLPGTRSRRCLVTTSRGALLGEGTQEDF